MRRLPSCMATTRAIGISWPSATRSAGSACGDEVAAAQVSSVSRSTAVRIVKSPGLHLLELVPGHRERHRDAGPRPRAVRRDHGRAAGPGGVDEHLAATLLAHELGGRDLRVEERGPRRDGTGGRGDVRDVGVLAQRHEHVHAFGAAGLDASGKPGVVQHLPDQQRGRDRHPEPVQRLDVVGGSRSRIRWVCRSLSTRISAGWYSTARWLASHTRVRRSSQTG